jgi:hypothetical protein
MNNEQHLPHRVQGIKTTAPQTQHEVQCGLLLDVVVRQRAPVFKLLASKNEALLVWGNA